MEVVFHYEERTLSEYVLYQKTKGGCDGGGGGVEEGSKAGRNYESYFHAGVGSLRTVPVKGAFKNSERGGHVSRGGESRPENPAKGTRPVRREVEDKGDGKPNRKTKLHRKKKVGSQLSKRGKREGQVQQIEGEAK